MLEHLRQQVAGEHRVDGVAVGVARRMHGGELEQHDHHIRLQDDVGHDVAAPLALGDDPVRHGPDTDQQHRHQRQQAGAHVDPVDDLRRDQRHEGDGHRQPVPEQRLVVRLEVVVARAGGGEQHADAEDQVGPALGRAGERGAGGSTSSSPAPPASAKATFEVTSRKFSMP